MDTVSCCCYLLQFSNNVIIITKIFVLGEKYLSHCIPKIFGTERDVTSLVSGGWLKQCITSVCVHCLVTALAPPSLLRSSLPWQNTWTHWTPLRPSLPQHYIIIQPIVQPYPSHLAAYVWWTILSPQSPPNHNTTRAIIHHHIPPKQYIYQLFLYLPHSCTCCCILQMQV